METRPGAQEYWLDGRRLEVSDERTSWWVRFEGREIEAPHLDKALVTLLNVPTHIALKYALAIFNSEPGSDISL